MDFSHAELFHLQNTAMTDLTMTEEQPIEKTAEDGRHFVDNLSGFQMPSGEYACDASANDVTNSIKEQKRLTGAKERFRKIFQLGPLMMAILRKSDYRYIDVNDRFLEERNYTLVDVIGKTPVEMGVPEIEFNKIIETIELHGSVQNIESTLVTKFGSIGTTILSAETIQIDDQECILLAYNDVTEMKRMQAERVEQLSKLLALEADLSHSNKFIADIVDNMSDVFYVLDNQWRFTFVNNKATELLLKTREELLGNVLWEVIPKTRGTNLELNYLKAKNDGLTMTFEYLSVLHKDTWYQVTAYPSEFGLSIYHTDITERKLMHEKLIKAQEEMLSVLESMTDCFYALDRDLQFTYINRAGKIAFGRSQEDLLGKKITEVIKVNDTALQYYHKVLSEKRPVTFESVSEALGNKSLEISVYPSETGLTCYFRDITSRKLAENEMARLDRLNLVGQLAAGIGHEIRNPMTTVRGYLQLLGEKPDCAARKPTFDLMISELDRANSIITEFLSLSQIKQTKLESQNLNAIINHLFPLLEADAFTQNKQITFIPGDIPNLELNGKEISQLVLNLTLNGLAAMLERGCLTIKSYLQDGTVVLAIVDEGCGIPPENLKKIGTPFFTTKDDGTGLGLATCYKIIESHKAKVHIESSSSGTTFSIIFPKEQDKNETIAPNYLSPYFLRRSINTT
ncbi:PAS domain S-box (fragment) [Candidatus Desulfosporosinus infrequens]|uniref:histidine kinase n=1 Tax=Candidatus Desulfosporosinus infrequens TaxID=2043169 RepID=A0A2U3LIK6_9FIRM